MTTINMYIIETGDSDIYCDFDQVAVIQCSIQILGRSRGETKHFSGEGERSLKGHQF